MKPTMQRWNPAGSVLRIAAIALGLVGLFSCQNELLANIETDVEIVTGSPGISVEFEGRSVSHGGIATLGHVRDGFVGSFSFVVRNSGGGLLELTGDPRVALSGPEAGLFGVSPGPAAEILGNSPFSLTFSPDASTGSRSATVTIQNNASSGGEFTFEVRGLVPWKMSDASWNDTDEFGRTLSTSRAGEAFVGSDFARVGGNNLQGAVVHYVYNYVTDQWERKTELSAVPKTASDGQTGDRYGASIEGKSSTFVAVGAPGHTSNTGKLYLYHWIGFTFEEATLTASDGQADDYYAASVDYAVGETADYVIVGAPGTATRPGEAYIYYEDDLTDQVWDSEAPLTASNGANDDGFGSAVAIHGNWALVAAPRHNDGRGAIYAFERTGTNAWTERQIIEPDGISPGDGIGSEIEMDGEKAAFSSRSSATVYVYTLDSGTWSHAQTITDPSGTSASAFGASLDMSELTDGEEYLAVGAPQDNTLAEDSGKAYLYRWNGSVYQRVDGYTVDGLERRDYFGSGVGLARNATDGINFLVAGARGDNRSDVSYNVGEGAAYALEF